MERYVPIAERRLQVASLQRGRRGARDAISGPPWQPFDLAEFMRKTNIHDTRHV